MYWVTLVVLVLIAMFAVIAKSLRQPYPIVFVIGGALLAFVPGLPRIELEPDVVFLVFLPPLLYIGGASTDWRNFARNFQPIVSLAVGLVVVTTVIVAFAAHALVGMPFAAALVLGAVVSPPDAVATEAIAAELPLPRSLQTILSGESLINDATALVVYGFAVSAVMTGTFSLWQAGLQFIYVSVVGVTIGAAAVAILSRTLVELRRRRLAEETISVIFSLITPFVAYLTAESVHASGVLAAVTAGILTAQNISRMLDHSARIIAFGVWSVLEFMLNGVLFMLIGLELRGVAEALGAYPPLTLAGYGAAISAVVIVVRFAWVYAIGFVRLQLARRYGWVDDRVPSGRSLLVLAWAGMRGIVTLATSLAIPVALPGGAPFPNRDLVIFLAFCVIVVTLVGQGLTLPRLIRSLPQAEPDDTTQTVSHARARTAAAALAALQSLESTFVSPAHWEVAGRLRGLYEELSDDALGREGPTGVHAAEIAQAMRMVVVGAEREELDALRRRGEIRDDVYRQLQWDLDLIESRIS